MEDREVGREGGRERNGHLDKRWNKDLLFLVYTRYENIAGEIPVNHTP